MKLDAFGQREPGGEYHATSSGEIFAADAEWPFCILSVHRMNINVDFVTRQVRIFAPFSPTNQKVTESPCSEQLPVEMSCPL